MEKENNPRNGPLMRFFHFCAAADKDILKQCPRSENNKYASIGATVLFTGILASISGGYALFVAFDSFSISVAMGLLWGLLVFNLDRFLVSTMKKTKGKLKEVIQITPRLLLAVLLAIVISSPLELKIFEEEINETLHYAGAKKIDRLDSLYETRIEAKQIRIDNLKADTEKALTQRDEYYDQYVCECDGTCGTGQKGRGSECERKENKYLKSDEEYKAISLANNTEISEIRDDITALKTQRDETKATLQSSFADGLLIRLNALKSLPYGPQLAIVLLLIAIEIAPILVKLLSPYGPYDHVLKTMEYEFEIEEITSINMRNQQLNNQLTVMASIEQNKLDQEIKNNEGAMKLIGDAHLELVKEQLQIWLEEEKEKIKSQHSK